MEKVIKHKVANIIKYRRWFVLTKTHILSYKEERVYKDPTEIILMNTCSTVKSADEEINKPNAFVSIKIYNRLNSNDMQKLEVNGRTYYM